MPCVQAYKLLNLHSSHLAFNQSYIDLLKPSLHAWIDLWMLLQVVHRFEENHGPITALAATAEDCILAGCHNGCMLVFAPRTTAIQAKFNVANAPWQPPAA